MPLRDVRVYFESASAYEQSSLISLFRKSRKMFLNVVLFQNSQRLVESGSAVMGSSVNFRNSKTCQIDDDQEVEITLFDNQEQKKMGFLNFRIDFMSLQYGGSLNQEFSLCPMPEFKKFSLSVVLNFSMNYNPLASTTANMNTYHQVRPNSAVQGSGPNPLSQIGMIVSQRVQNSFNSVAGQFQQMQSALINPFLPHPPQSANAQPPVPSNQIRTSSSSFLNGSSSSFQSASSFSPGSFRVNEQSVTTFSNADQRTIIENGLLINQASRWIPNSSSAVSDTNIDNTVFQNFHALRNYSGYMPTSYEELVAYLGPLPPHITRCFDNNSKRWYFKDSQRKCTSMLDPRLEGLLPTDPPLGSEWILSHFDPLGIPLFINSQAKTTTFQDPRTGVILIPCSEIFSMHVNPFHLKVMFFHILCSKYLRDGMVKLDVNRSHLFESSYASIMSSKACDLHRRPFFQIAGEKGLDYGGIKRELLRSISEEIMNPMYGLFSYVDPTRNYFLRVNQSSSLQTGHLQYFRFFGRIIGLILFHRAFLQRGLNHIFFKILLGRETSMSDIEQVDPELYNSLSYIRDNDINDLGLEMYFVYEHDYYGQPVTYPLIEDGEQVQVNDENKADYLHHFTQYYFSKAIEQELASIRLGVSEIVPITWLMYFSEKDLELLLCGIQNIDVDDWKNNTIYKNGFKPTDQTVIFFWKLVEEMDHHMRSLLLQFCTGSPQVPVGGFSQLMGSTDVQKFTISKAEKSNVFPKSHTCFNRLTLPDYKNYDLLKEKLFFAIQETQGFHEE